MFALWSDGTFIWSEHAPTSLGRPYRQGHLPTETVQRLLSASQSRIESIAPDRRSYCVPDGEEFRVSVETEDESYEISWWPGNSLTDELETARREMLASLLGARPIESSSSSIAEFAFSSR